MPGIGRLGGGDGESRWKNDRSPGTFQISRDITLFGKTFFRKNIDKVPRSVLEPRNYPRMARLQK